MTDNEQSRLRFDINENVSFHDDQPGIDTLLSLDLTPEVRIEALGANVRIVGAIRLSGAYLGPSDTTPAQQAEHLAQVNETDEHLAEEDIHYVIPVEITLPAERVPRLEDVTAEIQSFDYELRSAHELSIEAQLVVDGLQLESGSNVSQASFGMQEQGRTDINVQDDLTESVDHPETTPEEPVAEHQWQPEEASEEQHRFEEWHAGEAEEPQLLESSRDEQPRHHSEERQLDNDAIQKQSETKIHFQPKVESVEQKPSAELSLNEMLVNEEHESPQAAQSVREAREASDDRAERQEDSYVPSDESDVLADEEETDDQQQTEMARPIGIEWIKQLHGGAEDNFHRMRMVIVQKEDTLESIADRYQLSSVELLQLNKLESGELEQGQVVYLPDRTDHP